MSRVTDKGMKEMLAWAIRPLIEVYAAIFIDAVMVEGPADGHVANRLVLRGAKTRPHRPEPLRPG